jgi:hypothetical protein
VPPRCRPSHVPALLWPRRTARAALVAAGWGTLAVLLDSCARSPTGSSPSTCRGRSSPHTCACRTLPRDRAHPVPHLRRVWAHPSHIYTVTGLAPCHICTGTGLIPATSAPGLGSPPCSSLPHLLRDWVTMQARFDMAVTVLLLSKASLERAETNEQACYVPVLCVCSRFCVRACVRACASACVRACVLLHLRACVNSLHARGRLGG